MGRTRGFLWILLLALSMTGCGPATPEPSPVPLPRAYLTVATTPAARAHLDRWINLYGKAHPEVVVEAVSLNAANAQRALSRGEVDLALLEASPLPAFQGVITATVVAHEPIAVVVHPENRLRELSAAAVGALFSGRMADWSQVGGDPGAVRVYVLPDGAGEVQSFQEQAMAGRGLASWAIVRASVDSMARIVAEDRGAIGLLRASAADESVTVLRIDGALPSEKNYPWQFPLFLAYGRSPSPEALAFLRFAQVIP
jgi:ABC-type phosphate transport system substrate-binding protein